MQAVRKRSYQTGRKQALMENKNGCIEHAQQQNILSYTGNITEIFLEIMITSLFNSQQDAPPITKSYFFKKVAVFANFCLQILVLAFPLSFNF